jgi:hypothetical protein
VVQEYFQTLAGEFIPTFQGLVGICHRADYHFPLVGALNLLGQKNRRIDFNIHELSPSFPVPGESSHESGITIQAAVLASDVWIETVGLLLNSLADQDFF